MIQRRAVTLAALVVLVVWARPALAQTDVGPFGSCKKGFAIRASAEPLFAPDDKTKVVGTLLRGAPRNPVTIECDDTRVFADELKGTGVLVNSVCPGWCRTDMGGAGATRSIEEGVDTIVWLATLPEGGPSGGFFRDRAPIPW